MAVDMRKRGGQPGSKNGNWRGGEKTGLCVFCGLEFKAPNWEMKHRQYCSRECSDKAKINPRAHRTRPHVHVVEKVIGMRVPDKAVIHHINGNRNDNRPENLLLCENQAEHRQIHMRKRISDAGGNPDIEKICSCCRQIKPKTDFHKANKADGYRCYCKTCQTKKYLERKSANGASN